MATRLLIGAFAAFAAFGGVGQVIVPAPMASVVPQATVDTESAAGIRWAPAPHAHAARVADAATASGRTPKVSLFNGLDSVGISAGDVNDSSSPSDATGAVGPNNYVEITNNAIAVYDRTLNLATPELPLFDWIPNGLVGECHPQVQWDQSSTRWLVVILGCSRRANPQRVYFGWTKTSSPTDLANGWCLFELDTARIQEDMPKLGHNSKYLIIGANGYDTSVSSTNPPFTGAKVIWIPKPPNGAATCALPSSVGQTTGALLAGDHATKAFSPVPVNTITSDGNGYVLSAYDPSGGNGQASGSRHALAVWHLDSSGVFHQDVDVGVSSYSTPFAAPQAGGSNLISTLDGRLTQAVGDAARGIWTQHTVDGAGHRSVVDWYEVTVAGSSTALNQQGAISSSTDFVFNAAIAPRFDAGGAAIFYNRSSASIDPVIASQSRTTATAAGAMDPGELILGTSTDYDNDLTCFPVNGPACAWGAYAGASADPVQSNAVWGSETLTSAPADLNGDAQWGTQNFAVLATSAPAAPTGVTALADGTRTSGATISWTPPSVDPTAPVTTYTITAYLGLTAGPQLIVAAPASNAHFVGLTVGMTYTFTVIASNSVGPGPESAPSNAVAIGLTSQSVAPTPSPRSESQASPAPTPPQR